MAADDQKEVNAETRITLGPGYTRDLTPGAAQYFVRAVREYAERLKREAENIEGMEHTGGGPPEITAAHVEEARWVSLRRMRRAIQSKRWIMLIRVGEFAMSILVGIGASNFTETWGAIATVCGVLFGSILVIVERELQREI